MEKPTEATFAPFEADFRASHSIPADAQQVLIFAETSHWDPNWLQTSDDYYRRYVEANLLAAVAELQKEPRRVYSVENMFFLRMFWEGHPELHETLRDFVKTGRLCLTSTGVSSADTLVTDPEAILRDLLLGQEWLRANGLESEPDLAYFPDCFGHTPALPALLNAAGFSQTAFARIDGMYGMGADYDPKSTYPRPGSNAHLLLEVEKTLDFYWRAPDGSRILTHWNAFSYFQGDMLAYRGAIRAYLFPKFLYSEDRSDQHVFGRIQGYISQLEPLSRTPYLFCPVGMDFNAPIPGLLELLDGYNQRAYPTTGTWAVNARLSDYLTLVGGYPERLPVIDLDPNPYWTGFYTSRPSLKQSYHRLVRDLLQTEQLAALSGRAGEANLTQAPVSNAWWAVGTANHHDFITGTSTDAVAYGEQTLMLEQAAGAIRPLAERLANLVTVESPPPAAQVGQVTCERQGERISICTPHYELEMNEARGGTIMHVWDAVTGQTLLDGPSNELVDYAESGGLWRMGMEYRGGKFRLADRSGERRTALDVITRPGEVEVRGQVTLAGKPFRFAVLFRADSPLIRFRLSGRAADGHTVCARFSTGLAAQQVSMENPGGVAVRPPRKLYNPTFWPVQRFFHLQDASSQAGAAFLLALPGAAAYRPEDRSLELVTQRNATHEKAYGLLPILACPASGHERQETTLEYALAFTPSGGWQENALPQAARAYARDPWGAAESRRLEDDLQQSVWLSSADVWLETLKPAWRGQGVIARLVSYALPGEPLRLSLRGWKIRAAWLCDARERDLTELAVQDGQALVRLEKTITSLRLVLDDV